MAVAMAICVISYFLAGRTALIGMALGLATTAALFVGQWLGISLAGKEISQTQTSGRSGVFVAIGVLLSLPISVIGGQIAQMVGGAAPGYFLWGLGLVYFALIGWALAKS